MPTLIAFAATTAFAAAVAAAITMVSQARTRRLVFASFAAALLIALTACGGASTDTTASTAPSGINRGDPAAVNTAWVAAVRDNDRAAALALYDAGSQEANNYNINEYLSAMADDIHPAGKPRYNYGAFRTAEALDVRDAGAGKRAFSRWVFENIARCFYAEMSQVDGQWSVNAWYHTNDSDCGA